MTLSADDVSRRMQDADEALSAIVWRRLDRAVAAGEPRTGSLAFRVRRLVVENLGRTPSAPDGVADACCVFALVARRVQPRRLVAGERPFHWE